MTRRDRGSMFVEAMIAAAMVALALTAALRVVSDSANRDRQVAARRVALLIAQSQLAAAGSEIALKSGETAGVVGDLVWRLDVSPFVQAGEPNAAGGMWRVVVTVRPRAGGPALVALSSLRLGPGA